MIFSGIMGNLSVIIENFFGNLSKNLSKCVSIFQMTSSKEP